MNETDRKPVLHWAVGGLLLGGLLLVAVAAVKPLGVSTQYARAIAGLAEAASPGAVEANAYLASTGLKFGYGEMLVIGIPLGALLAALLTGRIRKRTVPTPWRERFGPSTAKRYAAAAFGGFVLLFGARLAGGCTSGHILAGMSQLALSGFVFFAAAFGVGALAARLIYAPKGV